MKKLITLIALLGLARIAIAQPILIDEYIANPEDTLYVCNSICANLDAPTSVCNFYYLELYARPLSSACCYINGSDITVSIIGFSGGTNSTLFAGNIGHICTIGSPFVSYLYSSTDLSTFDSIKVCVGYNCGSPRCSVAVQSFALYNLDYPLELEELAEPVVKPQDPTCEEIAYYNLLGQKISQPQGLTIVHYKCEDGYKIKREFRR